jgi:hypothetical protein
MTNLPWEEERKFNIKSNEKQKEKIYAHTRECSDCEGFFCSTGERR